MLTQICQVQAEEIGRRVEAGFPDLKTFSTTDDESAAGNVLVLSVFQRTRGGGRRHFSDFHIRCHQAGPDKYAIDVSCDITTIEAGKEEMRFGREKIEKVLRDYRSLGVSAIETTKYRRGIPKLGE